MDRERDPIYDRVLGDQFEQLRADRVGRMGRQPDAYELRFFLLQLLELFAELSKIVVRCTVVGGKLGLLKYYAAQPDLLQPGDARMPEPTDIPEAGDARGGSFTGSRDRGFNDLPIGHRPPKRGDLQQPGLEIVLNIVERSAKCRQLQVRVAIDETRHDRRFAELAHLRGRIPGYDLVPSSHRCDPIALDRDGPVGYRFRGDRQDEFGCEYLHPHVEKASAIT